MPPYNGKTKLRDSMVIFFNLYERTISGDYAEIEALQFESQKSYQAMKNYLNKIDFVNKKMMKQKNNVSNLYEKFASENNINLINNESELSAKMGLSNIVNDYYNKIYLIYFQTFIPQTFLIKALNDKDTLSFDSWTDSLNNAVTKGIIKLSTINPYNGDNSLKISCSKSLQSAKLSLNLYIPAIRNYFSTKTKYEIISIKTNNIPESELTQIDIDKYNNIVKKYNTSVESYNQSIKKFNILRNDDFNQWNTISTKFLDKNIPK